MIMINFKYALLQLVRKITTTFFIVLQIALAFFLMFTLIEVKNATVETLKAIDSIYKVLIGKKKFQNTLMKRAITILFRIKDFYI